MPKKKARKVNEHLSLFGSFGVKQVINVGLIIIALMIGTYFFFAVFHGFIPADNISGDLQKGDWLSFWGNIIGVFVTAIFAILAWNQNITLARINEQREKKDTEFTKLELAANFHSDIRIEKIIHVQDMPQIRIYFRSVGKIPPSKISFDQFEIFYGKKENQTLIDAVHSMLDIKYVKYPLTAQSNNESPALYLAVIPESFRTDAETYMDKSDPVLRLVLSFKLYNPFNIVTSIIGEAIFSYNFKATKEGREYGEPIHEHYDLYDSFLITETYEYSGEK